MEEIIYIIQGSTGEYSDHTEWIVCAFDDEDIAREFVKKCTEETMRIQQDLNALRDASVAYCNYNLDVKDGILKPHQYDPNFQIDYTGTNYTFFKTKLLKS